MKVSVTIEIDMPDECKDFSVQEIRDSVWENFLQYARVQHLQDQLKWTVDKCANSHIIANHHKVWSEYLKTAKIIHFSVL